MQHYRRCALGGAALLLSLAGDARSQLKRAEVVGTYQFATATGKSSLGATITLLPKYLTYCEPSNAAPAQPRVLKVLFFPQNPRVECSGWPTPKPPATPPEAVIGYSQNFTLTLSADGRGVLRVSTHQFLLRNNAPPYPFSSIFNRDAHFLWSLAGSTIAFRGDPDQLYRSENQNWRTAITRTAVKRTFSQGPVVTMEIDGDLLQLLYFDHMIGDPGTGPATAVTGTAVFRRWPGTFTLRGGFRKTVSLGVRG